MGGVLRGCGVGGKVCEGWSGGCGIVVGVGFGGLGGYFNIEWEIGI